MDSEITVVLNEHPFIVCLTVFVCHSFGKVLPLHKHMEAHYGNYARASGPLGLESLTSISNLNSY